MRERMIYDLKHPGDDGPANAETVLIAALSLARGFASASRFIDTRLLSLRFARLVLSDFSEHLDGEMDRGKLRYFIALDAGIAAEIDAARAVKRLKKRDFRMYMPVGCIAEEYSREILERGEYAYYRKRLEEIRAGNGGGE